MSYAEMRKALEAAVQNFENIYTQYRHVFPEETQEIFTQTIMNIEKALKSEPTTHNAKDGKYVIWLTPDEAGKLCQKYELEDYYFGIDDKNRKPTTSELVAELRKRDGVEFVEVPEHGSSRVLVWKSEATGGEETYDVMTYNSHATILRITE